LIEPVRILLVEDEAHDAELVLRSLKRAGLECAGRRVDTEREFREQLSAFSPHVVLSDFSMPQFDGMSALAVARELQPDVPFIFVSGTIGEEYAIQALKNGATDYVLKHDMARLPPAVERALQDAAIAAERQRMQVALQHSELRFRLAASTGDVWDWTVATGAAHISYQWKRRLGYDDDEVENTAAAWLALLHADDRSLVLQAFRAHLQHKAPYDVEYRARSKSGHYRWSHAKGQAMWDENGVATYMAGSVVDITDRKLAEIGVRRLNRVYAVLSGINSLIVHTRDRSELFRETCRIAVRSGQFLLAWVGLVDKASRQLKPVAWSGFGDNFMPMVRLSLEASDVDHYGVAGRAVAERRAMIVQDTANDPGVSARHELLDAGFLSFVILPVLVSGEVVGTLALYAGEAGFFDAAEMRLLLGLADDIAFALDHIDKAERLNYLAYYDALTGLANRALFHERLALLVETARREQHKLAVLSLNLDRFKAINDTLGRQGGDDLLKQVAQRFLEQSAVAGRFARIEADHFAIVLPEIRSEGDLARVIEQQGLAYFGAPFHIAGSDLRVSARVGIAVFPNDGDDGDTLFRHAEAAARKAKSRGERYLFYAQEMTDKIAGTLALENRLRRALEKNEFVLHYQPKVDMCTRRILGVEALIRWQCPEQGLVPPMQFIPLMEETGMILEAGAWALRQAVLDHRHWSELGIAPVPRIAVNVSQIQLRRSDFVDTVRAAIAAGTTPPGIDLEITESLVMEDIEGNIDKLNVIRGLGLDIAVDDFGTGYSSLRYLATLPVQTLKIDRSFIITMLDEPHTMTLVATVISMAHSLGLHVVAEGVESEAQADVLSRHGCDEMQGYLFSRPLALAQMTALLQAQGGAP
jgi:diguanylate cyclase (GGDEF)-like protein/PAS domain S-box-containing protein